MILQIWKQAHPIELRRPYRIVELFQTCDGMRSRLTHRSFETLQEAMDWIHHTTAEVPFKEGSDQ